MQTGTRLLDNASQDISNESSESRRSTEQVKLRVQPADALRLRAQADLSGRSLSDYVVHLLAGATAAPPSSERERTIALVRISRLAAAIHAQAEQLRLARGDLGRAFGLLKHLFETAPVAASMHTDGLATVIAQARAATMNADIAVSATAERTAALRDELAITAKRLSRL